MKTKNILDNCKPVSTSKALIPPCGVLEKIFLQIRTDKFYYLKFILEAYDGLAILSSSGIRKDIVVVRYPGEVRKAVFELISAIAGQLNPYRIDS